MKVVTLFENTRESKMYKCGFGLSLYIETKEHKILFDAGENDDFISNAQLLGVDLKAIDTVIISHGHFDHVGGLKSFMAMNSTAKIYIGKGAFDKHIVKILGFIKHDVGMDQSLESDERFIQVSKYHKIDDELTLFADITEKRLFPPGNKKLLMVDEQGNISEDDFEHEINLLISEGIQHHLICGCAHKGVVNIVKAGQDLVGQSFQTVIGGFHLLGLNDKKEKDKEYLEGLVQALKDSGVKQFITGHCTGKRGLAFIQSHMNNVSSMTTGKIFDL